MHNSQAAHTAQCLQGHMGTGSAQARMGWDGIGSAQARMVQEAARRYEGALEVVEADTSIGSKEVLVRMGSRRLKAPRS